MSNCGICPRTADDGLHACPRHAAELRAWLTELPAQERLLHEFLVPSAGPVQGHRGGGRAHAPVLVDLRILTLLGPGRLDPAPGTDDDGEAPIAAILGGWAGHIAYTYPAVTRDPHGTAHVQPCDQAWPRHYETVTGWCTWHLAYLPYTLTLPSVSAFHRTLDTLTHRLRDLTHTTPHTHPRAAPCPQCTAFGLVATDGQWDITCEICGHHLDPDDYETHAAAFRHAAEAAQANHSDTHAA